ncbi:MAG: fructose-specific PTS transporter subunit EIIC, partial [Peptostreptococcaceae bacterium]
AEAIIYSTDVAPKNTERFAHLPSVKTPVAAPLRRAKEIVQEALDVAEKQGKGEYVEVAMTADTEEKKSNWKEDLKGAVLTGVSHIVPLIVAGGMILAFAVLASQAFGLQDLYSLEGSWLWQLRKLSGGLIGTLLNPILAGYIAYSLAEKPALAPGFAAGLAADLIGGGFLGAMVGGLLAGYFLRFLKKKVPAQGTFAGFISFWVYPVVGSLVVGVLMLFVIGSPVAAINNGLINWLNGLSGVSSIILGAIIAGMVSFDLGGPVNKAAYTFCIGAISSGNFIPYAILASAKMVSAFGVTIATFVGKNLFTKQEKEIGMQTWILGLAGITEGAIPFMLEDPVRVIPSLVGGSVVTGAIVGYFNIGLQVPGAGIFSLALLEQNSTLSPVMAAAVWFFAAVLGALIAATLLIITRKQKIAKQNASDKQVA